MLPGKAEGTVDLRFTPPPGTTGLVCRAAGERRMSDPAAIDNLFAGALVSTNGWRPTPRMIIEPQADGALLFRPRSGGCPEAAYDVAVPAGLAGRPVKFEAITESIGGASWVFRMYVEQRDASGKQLPEPVYDRRWTTLMMPPDKTCRFVERGRIHPEARTLRFFLSLGTSEKKYDEHGLPRAEPARALTKLKLHRLALRPAEQLPFPKYADTHFPAGVSGEAGDCAIRLGGPDERAFWYQTRSMASWAAGFQLRREERLFFPAGAGTVEAWFKSDWKPTVARVNGKDVCRPIVLFQAHQSFRAYECKAGKGAMLELAYRPEPGELELVLVDVFKTKYTGTAARCSWTAAARCRCRFRTGRRSTSPTRRSRSRTTRTRWSSTSGRRGGARAPTRSQVPIGRSSRARRICCACPPAAGTRATSRRRARSPAIRPRARSSRSTVRSTASPAAASAGFRARRGRSPRGAWTARWRSADAR